MKKTLSELRIDAEEAKKELNSAILDDSFTGATKAKEKLDKAVSDYNAQAVDMDFTALCSKADPMKEAIEQLSISVLVIKPHKDKDTGVVTYSLEPDVRQIDLAEFYEFCKRKDKDITPDKFWTYKVEKFALLVTYRIMSELGLSTKKLEDTYYISDIAQKIDMGKTPISNNAMLKQLQMLTDAIIYEPDGDKNVYKVTSHDVAYILSTMHRRGRKSGTVVTPRASTMRQLVMDVLHRIVLNGDYRVEYHTKKEAREEAESSEVAKGKEIENKAKQ